VHRHRNAHDKGNHILSESSALRDVVGRCDLFTNLSTKGLAFRQSLGTDKSSHFRGDHMSIWVHRNEKSPPLKRESYPAPRGSSTRGTTQPQGLSLHFEQFLRINFAANFLHRVK
jgi:hypothetical protein